VTKLDPATRGEASLVYSTLLGGPANDAGSAIAVDSACSAYVTGTAGADFPTKDPVQAKAGGGADAFVSKLSPEGSSLVYSTLLGGQRRGRRHRHRSRLLGAGVRGREHHVGELPHEEPVAGDVLVRGGGLRGGRPGWVR